MYFFDDHCKNNKHFLDRASGGKNTCKVRFKKTFQSEIIGGKFTFIVKCSERYKFTKCYASGDLFTKVSILLRWNNKRVKIFFIFLLGFKVVVRSSRGKTIKDGDSEEKCHADRGS